MGRYPEVPVVFLLSLVLFSLASIPVHAAPWNIGVDDVVFDRDNYTDGYVGSCTLKISNTGDVELRFTKVEMRTSFGNFTWTGEITLPKGEQVEIEISFRVPIGTSAGDYSLEFYFEFSCTWQGKSEEGILEYSSDQKIVVKSAPKGAFGDIPGFPFEGIIVGLVLALFALLRKGRGNSIWRTSSPRHSIPVVWI